nr:LuxR C-terminal-related transcriptional regulator [Ornithinimicrobium cryptoxanthini]
MGGSVRDAGPGLTWLSRHGHPARPRPRHRAAASRPPGAAPLGLSAQGHQGQRTRRGDPGRGLGEEPARPGAGSPGAGLVVPAGGARPQAGAAHPAGAADPGPYRRGSDERQIGEALGLAEKTVKNYVTAILAKLGLERRTRAALYVATRRDRDPQH